MKVPDVRTDGIQSRRNLILCTQVFFNKDYIFWPRFTFFSDLILSFQPQIVLISIIGLLQFKKKTEINMNSLIDF